MAVRLEYQDAGMWLYTRLIDGNPSDMSIQHEMRELKALYPDKRVRALDNDTGRLIDMLQ